MKNIKNAYKILFVIVLAMMFLVPSYNVRADENITIEGIEDIIDGDIDIEKIRKIVEENPNSNNLTINILRNILEKYEFIHEEKEEENVNDCEGIFGDPNKEETTAYMIQKFLNYTKILAPLLVVLLSGFDFAKNALTGDADEMKKATKKLGIRIVCAVGVYLAPVITGFIINFINNSSIDATCNIK